MQHVPGKLNKLTDYLSRPHKRHKTIRPEELDGAKAVHVPALTQADFKVLGGIA